MYINFSLEGSLSISLGVHLFTFKAYEILSLLFHTFVVSVVQANSTFFISLDRLSALGFLKGSSVFVHLKIVSMRLYELFSFLPKKTSLLRKTLGNICENIKKVMILR